MAKYCTNCGKELDENAALCLSCGVLVDNKVTNNKEKKKGLPTWAIVLIIVCSVLLLPIIFLTLIGVFAYNIVDNTMNTIEDYIEEETVTQTGTIGDSLSTDEFNITLYDTEIYQNIENDENSLDTPSEGKEYLVFFFEVENISEDNEYISEYDFVGYVDGYEIEVSSLYNNINGIKELNANLPPNKKTKGYVVFEVDQTWQDFEVHYTNWFESNKLIYTITNDNNTNITGA